MSGRNYNEKNYEDNDIQQTETTVFQDSPLPTTGIFSSRSTRRMMTDPSRPQVIARHVEERPAEFCAAMSSKTRTKKFVQNGASFCCFWKGNTSSTSSTIEIDKDSQQDDTTQYVVRRKKKEPRNIFFKIYSAISLFCCFGSVMSLQNVNTKSKFGWLPNPNRLLIDFLNWMYRTSFFLLFACFAIFFYVLCLVFGVVIMWVGEHEPDCISLGGQTYGALSIGSGFASAFTLSWTTLSTVGYGNVAPTVDDENEDIRECITINFLLMVEAFVGVIYAGFCGAILFGKVLRFQSRAPVVFSDPLVIRLATSIASTSPNKNDFFRRKPSEDEESRPSAKDPTGRGLVDPPILEFRLVNLLHDEQAGEIIGASLQVVASKNADDTDPQILEFSNRERNESIDRQSLKASLRSSGASNGSQEVEVPPNIYPELKNDTVVKSNKARIKQSIMRGLRASDRSNHKSTHKDVTTYDEGNRDLIPKIIFSNIHIEEPQHPLFKRVWVGQHVLDESSPLLKDKVKAKLSKRQGLWPKSLCTAAMIKKSLDFNQIIVSITGVSNVTGSEVYAHHIYDFNDVIVGYEFVDILLQENSGAIKVDMGGLHCVVGQFGDECHLYMDSFG